MAAGPVISSVVKLIGDLLIKEANFLAGVSGKAKQMQTELKLMQSFLEDVDKRQNGDKRVQAWVSEIREAAYDAEVVIETFALKIESRRRGGIQNSFKRCACIFDETAELHNLGSQIEEITTRISNLTRSLQTYGIQPITSHEGEASSSVQGIQRRQRRQSYGHVIEEYTVGLERDIEILVAQLVNVEENYGSGVVSICGMGGLGKTTLAKKVFHHDGIRRHFEGFAWAYISQQCQRRDVWEGILFDLISPRKKHREEIKELQDPEVAKKLFQVLQEKKCLVIVDDIWTAEAWHDLLPAFAVGKAGSKVLLTTRNKGVAPSSFLHEPRCLNEEESLELLLKKAFPAGKHDDDTDFRNNKDVEKLGRKMVERCAGLPLAIIVLGAILATKRTLNEWKMVHENISSNLRRAKGQEQQDLGLFDVLALSYHELPYHLKACFLHLSHFPEDFEIPTQKLVRMWVAEGIVSSTQYEVVGEETILEDIAQHYLGELMYRCMVQVGVVGSTGRVKTCRLHDLMRELCLLKASQENFLEIIDLQDGNKQVDSFSSTHQVHRLAVYLGEEQHYLKYFPKQQRTLNLRSLSFFCTHKYGTKISRKVESGFSDFKLLKILDLEQCRIGGKLTSTIGNLIHLRYLSFKFDGLGKLTSSIGNLRCLQTLILRSNPFKRMWIPNTIWRMDQLRHLYLPTFDMEKCCNKLRVDNFRDLQTLKGFNSRIFDIKGLAKFTRLKKLQIRVNSLEELVEVQRSSRDVFNYVLSLHISWRLPINITANKTDMSWDYSNIIAEETDLQGLLSGCPNLCKLHLIGSIEKLPEFHRFEYPPNLTKLTLSYSKLDEDPMATLEKLPNLTSLTLDSYSFIGHKMVCSSKGFLRLKSLTIIKLLDLEEWFVGEEAMPCLYELTIAQCTNLKMVPDGLRFITTLRELKIVRMSEEFNNRLRGGEDSFKVQHVPSIIFKDCFVLLRVIR